MNYQPQWLRNEVLDGLSKLVTLSLDRTPAVDVIVGTAETWMEAICHRREWHESQDRMRVRQAFATLASSTSWPNPKQFLDALPARMTQRERQALMSPEEVERREESRDRVNEMLAQFGQRIGVNVSAPKEAPRQPVATIDDFQRCCEKGTREKPLCDDCRAWAQEVHGRQGVA
jgi:hypothetical protein